MTARHRKPCPVWPLSLSLSLSSSKDQAGAGSVLFICPRFLLSGKPSNITTSLRFAQEMCDFKSPKNLLRFCQTPVLCTFPWVGCIHLTGAGETGAVHCERKQSPGSQRNITAHLAVLWEIALLEASWPCSLTSPNTALKLRSLKRAWPTTHKSRWAHCNFLLLLD